MVSDATDQATRDFFAANDRFGLAEDDVHFVRQSSLPPLDAGGRLLLASRSSISMAPNGHGGLYAALVDGGVLDVLEQRGVRILSYIQIDNPLVRPVDPTFVGFHRRAESLISSKSVMKRHPGEKAGVFGRVDGSVSILEYSELSDRQAHEVNEDGQLTFGQGSIAAHCIDLGFARQVAADGLPYHRALKKVAFVDPSGELVQPDGPNATKFEMFLFDAIPRAARALVLETPREEEFAPIKNATGEDSPATCREALISQFRTWHRNAQLPVPDGPIEVDPLEAPDERTFQRLHGA
jgi:UDP-N-acetylglucosamine/UDP-N-acetylgalactosamine diphosphorylase